MSRLWGRAVRELQHAITTLVLSTTKPTAGRVAIVTLNADEENATAHAVLIAKDADAQQIALLSPDPAVTRIAIELAARRLERAVPDNIQYSILHYWRLLRVYRDAAATYSTHVLLPGRDFSKRRRHVHLTHGSGPKPDTTFRAPTNVLASITPQWVEHQLREYKLPPDTEVIEYMPRLEIMRRSIGDSTILERLGLDPSRPLVVWAPTYRKVMRGKELRVSGLPFSSASESIPKQIAKEVTLREATLVLKVHPHDVDSYDLSGGLVLTNSSLRSRSLTPYELFGAADVVVTDYSSIYIERALLRQDFILVRPDQDEFTSSDRGLRKPV